MQLRHRLDRFDIIHLRVNTFNERLYNLFEGCKKISETRNVTNDFGAKEYLLSLSVKCTYI